MTHWNKKSTDEPVIKVWWCDGCIGIPKGMEVEVVEIKGDRIAVVYEDKWYGYYPIGSVKCIEL